MAIGVTRHLRRQLEVNNKRPGILKEEKGRKTNDAKYHHVSISHSFGKECRLLVAYISFSLVTWLYE